LQTRTNSGKLEVMSRPFSKKYNRNIAISQIDVDKTKLNLKRFIDNSGFTQNEIAHLVGVTTTAVGSWFDLDSSTLPAIEKLIILSSVLKISLPELISVKEPEFQEIESTEKANDKQFVESLLSRQDLDDYLAKTTLTENEFADFYRGYDIFDKAADEVFSTSNPGAVLPREIKNKWIAEETDFDPQTHAVYSNNVGIFNKAALLRFRPIPNDEKMHKAAERIAKSTPIDSKLSKQEQEEAFENAVKAAFKRTVHAAAERVRQNLLDMKSFFDCIYTDYDLINRFTVPDKTDEELTEQNETTAELFAFMNTFDSGVPNISFRSDSIWSSKINETDPDDEKDKPLNQHLISENRFRLIIVKLVWGCALAHECGFISAVPRFHGIRQGDTKNKKHKTVPYSDSIECLGSFVFLTMKDKDYDLSKNIAFDKIINEPDLPCPKAFLFQPINTGMVNVILFPESAIHPTQGTPMAVCDECCRYLSRHGNSAPSYDDVVKCFISRHYEHPFNVRSYMNDLPY
jgi:transcriptional regulator with XRE-family HTH domain